jgi:hypothetical protein
LIVKGTAEQQEAVAQAIQALMHSAEQQPIYPLQQNESDLQKRLIQKRFQELNAASQPANNQ